MIEDSQETSQQSEPIEQPPLHIGRALAAERERQERSLVDVARALRLGVKQIEALEANDFAALPGNTFVRGFIRNYARLLEMDAERLLQAFGQKAPEEVHAVSVPPRGGEFSPYPSKRWMWYAAAVAGMLVGGPLLVYALLSESDAPPVPAKHKAVPVAVPQPVAPLQAARTTQPLDAIPPALTPPVTTDVPAVPTVPDEAKTEAAPVASVAVIPEGGKRLVFKFEAESWVEVRDKDRNRLLSQLNPAGTEQVVAGVPPFNLVVGNAAHVKVLFDGKQVDLTPYIDVDVARLTVPQ